MTSTNNSSSLHAFLLFNFLLAPILVLIICVILGGLLSVCEGWPFKDGFYFVSGSVSGANGFTKNSEEELTIVGEILEILISITALTLTGGVVGLASIMSLSSMLPEVLNVNNTTHAALTLLVFIPVVVLTFCMITGGLLAACEGWSFRAGFEYIVQVCVYDPSSFVLFPSHHSTSDCSRGCALLSQTVCGLAVPLTEEVPEGDTGKTVALIFAVAALGITSVIVGVVGAMALCEETIEALETQLARWEQAASALVLGGGASSYKAKVVPSTDGGVDDGRGGGAAGGGGKEAVTHTNVEAYSTGGSNNTNGSNDPGADATG